MKPKNSLTTKKSLYIIDQNQKIQNLNIDKLVIKKIEKSNPTIRNYILKERIITEWKKQDKALGSHRHTNSELVPCQTYDQLKFRRTPSPEKKNNRLTTSPIKPNNFISNRDHLRALTINFGKFEEDALKITKKNQKSYESLKKVGFINEQGRLNLKFLSRYEQLFKTKYSLKHSISSRFEKKSLK